MAKDALAQNPMEKYRRQQRQKEGQKLKVDQEKRRVKQATVESKRDTSKLFIDLERFITLGAQFDLRAIYGQKNKECWIQ
jgi:hypothetical protein